MHTVVYNEFEQILQQSDLKVTAVLEVGASRQKSESLLFLKAIPEGAKRYGVDMGGPYKVGDIAVLAANANELPFADAKFDLVLCNAVLEHDAQFWLTIAEMKRVLRPGGLLLIGVPGFADGREYTVSGGSTVTLPVHHYPDDYYRFSPSAMAKVFLAGLDKVGQRTVMKPPRIIGWGTKAGSSD